MGISFGILSNNKQYEIDVNGQAGVKCKERRLSLRKKKDKNVGLTPLKRTKSADSFFFWGLDVVKTYPEYVWDVTVKPRGLGSSKNISGHYRLCLTNKILSLIRMNSDVPDLTFQLDVVRRCGHSDCFFYMEVGRSSVIGPGEIWMQVDDTSIAHNMHEAILGTMTMMKPEKGKPTPHKGGSMYGPAGPAGPATQRPRTNSEGQSYANKKGNKRQTSVYVQSSIPAGHSPNSSSPQNISNLADQYIQEQRMRSGSIDSRGTNSSMSTDDCDSGSDHKSGSGVSQSGTRSQTPESHPSHNADYLPMSPAVSLGSSPAVSVDGGYLHESYMDMDFRHNVHDSHRSYDSQGVSDGYISMTPTSVSSSPARSFTQDHDSSYLDMTPVSHALPTVQENKASQDCYLDMSPAQSQSPQSTMLRPAKQHSYLQDPYELPKRTYSVGSKPIKKPSIRQPLYMDEVDLHGTLDNSKSNSAPHLIPDLLRVQGSNSPGVTLKVNPHKQDDFLMEMDFNRPRTSSDCYKYERPRTNSWGTAIRPRSASHGTSSRKQSRSKESLKKLSTESLKTSSQNSLNRVKADGYMEMSPTSTKGMGTRSVTPDRSHNPKVSVTPTGIDYMAIISPGTQSKSKNNKKYSKSFMKLPVPNILRSKNRSPTNENINSSSSDKSHSKSDDKHGNVDSYIMFNPIEKSPSKIEKQENERSQHDNAEQITRRGSADNMVSSYSQPRGSADNMVSSYSQPNNDSYMVFQPSSSSNSNAASSTSGSMDSHLSFKSSSSDNLLQSMVSPDSCSSDSKTVTEVEPNTGGDTYMFSWGPNSKTAEINSPQQSSLTKVKSYIQDDIVPPSLPAKPKKSLQSVKMMKFSQPQPPHMIQSASSGNLESRIQPSHLHKPRERHSMSDISDVNADILDLDANSHEANVKTIVQSPQLNYASLDLTSNDDVMASSNSIGRHSSTGDSDNNEGPLSYAEIDFVKSEGLRASPGRQREPTFSLKSKKS